VSPARDGIGLFRRPDVPTQGARTTRPLGCVRPHAAEAPPLIRTTIRRTGRMNALDADDQFKYCCGGLLAFSRTRSLNLAKYSASVSGRMLIRSDPMVEASSASSA
jgi:hypothetical protein